MPELVEVTYIDGTSEVVTVEEAETLRENGELATPVPDGKALTKEDFWGEGYGD
jgi:hypothetical protein